VQSRWFAPILVLAALLGWLLASLFPDHSVLAPLTRVIQTSFLAALKMIIAPLIFFSLLTGVMQLRKSGSMGRLGGITVLYYLCTSAIAICIGLLVVLFIHPWTEYPPLFDTPGAASVAAPAAAPLATPLTTKDATNSAQFIDLKGGTVDQVIANLLSKMLANPFAALAELNILGILTFAILFGLAAAWVLPKDSPWPDLLDQVTQVIYQCANWVLLTLPLGLFAITYQLTEKIELHTMVSLGHFALVVLGATALHGFIILPLIGWWLTKTNPVAFFRAASQPLITAFLTSSSAATLPLSMAAAEGKLGVSRNKAAFVLPLGATVNMDGTALFEGMAIIFLAYMFGIPLDTMSIVLVFLVTMLASAGAPGIPSASMAGLQVVMLAVGIPLEGIALLLLIERPLDTFRTAVNVEGDLIGAMIAERWS